MFLGALGLVACAPERVRQGPPAPPSIAPSPSPIVVAEEPERASLIVEIVDRDADARELARTELRLVSPPREGSGRARTSELTARVDADESWRELRVRVHRERPGDDRLSVVVERSRPGARGLEFRMEGTRAVDAGGVLLGRVARPGGGETEIRLATDAS